jgi:hypothetical protein
LRANRSLVGWSLLALAGIVLAVIGVAAFIAMAQGASIGSSGGGTASNACSPQPCLDLQGYMLWVSNLTEDAGIVRMQVKFQNASQATHAAPEDLRLIDSNQQSSPATQDPPGCTRWTRTEFSNGAKYGPITVCFRPSAVDPPLTLRWSPDLGLFCCQADVRVP